MRSADGTRDALRRLASAHGIQLSYTAHGGRRVRTSTDALVATLDALGVGVCDDGSVDEQVAAVTQERCEQPLEPVIVMRGDGSLSSPVRLPAGTEPSACSLIVTREDGGCRQVRLSGVVDRETVADDGSSRALTVTLTSLGLPSGYHEIAIEGPGVAADAMLLAPPPAAPVTARAFGVFAPVYGLRGRSDWGVGTFTELAELADHVGSLGAEIVGTLPMFPIFFAPPVDPSPYLPVSRLFVNELFIDVEALPEFVRSGRERGDLTGLSSSASVDYGAVMAHKRGALEACAVELVATPTARRAEFEAFLDAHPELVSYADFRAADERLGTRWRDWPTEPGTLPEGSINPAAQRYHRYVQFAAAEQLAAAAKDSAQGSRAGLYLDLPVGVHPDGYDTWSRADLFAPATVGAPPDRLAPQGQAWGFPPLHPQRMRRERYRYVISCFRTLLAHARVIRIDHVLGLQRVFWIPAGAGAESGAYVQYPREELMAIIALEADRAHAVVVGEDLGTVPAGIRQAMDRDAMLHSFVYQFVATPDDPLPQPRSPSLASLGSHDLPRFAAFWSGADIDDRVSRGVTTTAAGKAEHVERQRLVDAVAGPTADQSVRAAFATCATSLAAGPAPYVMVDLADLEGETEPDNKPGTGPEAGNWRRRLARPLASIIDDDRVSATLTDIATQRAAPQGVHQ